MRDFSVSRSFALMRRTAPFLMFRSMVFVGIALGFVLATGLGAGIGYGMGAAGSAEFQDNTVFWGGASGFGLMAGVVFLVRDLLLSGVRVSHAAAMVEVLQGGVLPEGRAQILRAQTMVTQRFGPAGALFALDRAIRGVIAAVVRDLAGAGWGAARGIVAGLAGRGRRGVLRLAAAQMNEVILATAIRSGADSPAACARAALVLWAQNAAPVLVGAAWLALLSYALALGVFLAMLAPAAGVDYLLPGGVGGGAVHLCADLCLGGEGGADRAVRHGLPAAGVLVADGRAKPRSGVGGAAAGRFVRVPHPGRAGRSRGCGNPGRAGDVRGAHHSGWNWRCLRRNACCPCAASVALNCVPIANRRVQT